MYCDGLRLHGSIGAAEVSVIITNGHTLSSVHDNQRRLQRRRRRQSIVSSVIPIAKRHFPACSIKSRLCSLSHHSLSGVGPIFFPVHPTLVFIFDQFQRSYISPISWWLGRILFLCPARQWGSDSRLACLQLRLEVLPQRKNHGIGVLCISQVSGENQ